MKHLLPPQVLIKSQPNKSGSVGSIFRNWHANPTDFCGAKVGIIGVPFDFGTKVSGGREGSSQGPSSVRNVLAMGTTYFIENKLDIAGITVLDFGDVQVVPNDPETTYNRVSDVIQALLDRGITPVTIGGSHDISFSTIRGMANYYKKKTIGGINVDAHLDVREIIAGVISSGAPFRAALESIEEFQAQYFTTIGVTGNTNAKAHFDYLLNKGASIITLNEFRKQKCKNILDEALRHNSDASFLSIDIDAVCQSYAPGCSAPALIGMNPEEISELVFLAGKSKKIKMMDVVEFNPCFDQDNKTAKLVAYLILQFIAGIYF